MNRTQRRYSQNFLHNQELVKKLLDSSSIGKKDIVLEIGPGQGIITQQLARKAHQVIAIEIDQDLLSETCNKLDFHNILYFKANALNFPLPFSQYKIFSNLPFAIEGRFVRQILDNPQPLKEAFLVVRKKPAFRWTGQSSNSLFYLKYFPWFQLDIKHHFKGSDFRPRTHVQAVLLSIVKRQLPLLPARKISAYHHFINQGFKGGGRISQNLGSLLTNQQLNHITQKIGISFHSKPSDVDGVAWIDLFKSSEKMIKKGE